MTEFQTDFMSSVWNFCGWVVDNPPCETFPSGDEQEKHMFSQARGELNS